ncbi:MAG: class I SAM-dependent methyltransferase [SAR324 cluster bacterium]|nr:class I SAM-dependent methyltransferase [SAR324 cluster bacterium]MCZ6558535.1 class I SAM-dependent methyltransferase [SAR324 cluster bacterium]
MAATLQGGYSWIIENYLDGRLPMPGLVLQGLLKGLVEANFRFAKTYDELPLEWSGAVGPIVEHSKDLMQIHYDKPAVLFENFLGPSMKYTMALYENGARDLEQAQETMLEDLCRKIGLQDGDNVLDIACGFGSLSAYILRNYPSCKVTALNLSQVQYDWISARQSEPGQPFHTDRFRIVKEDFSKSKFDRQFDRIMVIGLFEHIRNIKVALEKIAQFLKPDGKVILHFIAYNNIIRQMADVSEDLFFNKYIFPGGRFWYFKELPRYQQHLKLEDSWFLNGNNYKRTLQAWRKNFWRNIESVRKHPNIDERFIRTWDLYLRFCIATFGAQGGRNVGNGQYLMSHARPAS